MYMQLVRLVDGGLIIDKALKYKISKIKLFCQLKKTEAPIFYDFVKKSIKQLNIFIVRFQLPSSIHHRLLTITMSIYIYKDSFTKKK